MKRKGTNIKNRKKSYSNLFYSSEIDTFAHDFSAEGRKAMQRMYPPSGPNCLNIIRQMYVVVEINGQQFKAEQGKRLFVHHIQNAENGAVVEFDKVLLVDNNGEVKVGAPVVEGAKVVCEVRSHLVKGEKVLIFHKKRRKGYRKLNGHRQEFTEVVVKEVVA